MTSNQLEQDRFFLSHAVAAVEESLSKCPDAIPIGAVLVVDGVVRATGTNQRIQQDNPILHGETACLENTGVSVSEDEFARSTLYTTLSPCFMCAGSALRFKIPRIVIAENRNFEQSELLLRASGVELAILDDEGCAKRMKEFIDRFPEIWYGDITLQPPKPKPDYSQADLKLMARYWEQLGFILPQEIEAQLGKLPPVTRAE